MQDSVLGRNTHFFSFCFTLLIGLLLLCPNSFSFQANDEGLNKTLQSLQFLTGDEPAKRKIAEIIKDKNTGKKLIDYAVKKLEKDPNLFNVNSLEVLGRSSLLLRDFPSASKFYKSFVNEAKKLGSGKKIASGYGSLIQVLFETKKYKECEKVCQEFLDITLEDEASFLAILQAKPTVFRRMVLCQARQGNVDDAIKRVDKMVKDQPENWLNLEFKARIFREAGKYKESESTYSEVIEKIKGDKRLKEDQKEDFIEEVNYTLTNVYVELKQIDKAGSILEDLLKKNPDNSTYHNDLGYIWADNNQNLDKAETLIRKALSLDREARKKKGETDPNLEKDNSSYLDSLAWVLYKKKKFGEAKKVILEAIKDEEGNNIEILDHLGDIHQSLGEKSDAIKAWKLAIESATDSHRDKTKKKEVEGKLNKISEEKKP